MSGPVSPNSEELSRLIGAEVTHRETLRRTNLSVVERLRVPEFRDPYLILKTSVPELAHEAGVHRIASNFEINAAAIVVNGVTDGWPWLVIEDFGSRAPGVEPTPDEVGDALERLAEFHAKSMATVKSRSIAPDRTPGFLASHQSQLIELVENAFRSKDLTPPPLQRLRPALTLISNSLANMPPCIVHGDFDPGNLVFTRDRWRAYDWGLSHWNIPLVDVAHMTMRFAEETRDQLIERYFRSARRHNLTLDQTLDPVELVKTTDLAHKAFFVWWHSYCVANLDSDASMLLPVIAQRIEDISSYERPTA